MTESWRQRVLWTAALIALATGAILSFGTVSRLQAARETLARRTGELAAVDELVREAARYHAAYARVRDAAGGTLPDLDALAGEHLPGVEAETRNVSTELMPGWRLARREFAWADAPVAGLMTMIEAAEQAPEGAPAWRLARGSLRATPNQPGRAQAVIVFEAPVPVQ